ncbi:MAG: VanW family protein, partial [bacterium]
MQKVKQSKINILGILKFFGLGIILGLAILYIGLRIGWKGKIFPGVVVGTTVMGGKTTNEAHDSLSNQINITPITLKYNNFEWLVPPELVEYQIEDTIKDAYRFGRQLSIHQFASILEGREDKYLMKVVVNIPELNVWLDGIAQNVEIAPVATTIEVKNKQVKIINGKDGTLLNRDELIGAIEKSAQELTGKPIEITTRTDSNGLGEEALKKLNEVAHQLLGKKLILEIDANKVVLSDEKIISLLNTEPQADKVWNIANIQNYVTSLADTYSRESENAKFEVIDGKVKEFAPGKDGIVVQIAETSTAIADALNKLITTESVEYVAIVLVRTPPTVTTSDVNSLGIEKRIGVGESYYAHSIPGRIHNVGLTASRITGTLVAPGEEFSFDKVLGEISGATGFAPAYVIKNGRTELGDGGGVCQVSTTVFRAAMSAGLPIIERWAHAYRVGYYEQGSEPGIDATVFSPSKDFRFRNDTPGHILVQA